MQSFENIPISKFVSKDPVTTIVAGKVFEQFFQTVLRDRLKNFARYNSQNNIIFKINEPVSVCTVCSETEYYG